MLITVTMMMMTITTSDDFDVTKYCTYVYSAG